MERELEELIDKATKEGAVYAILHFDAHGKDKEAVKHSLVDFVGRLTKEPGVIYCKGNIEESIEYHELYSSYTEVEIIVDSFSTLVRIAVKYGPIAVEIEKPDEIKLTIEEAQGLVLDVSQAAQDYTTFILKKTLKPEERKNIELQLKRRAEIGKMLKEKAKKKK